MGRGGNLCWNMFFTCTQGLGFSLNCDSKRLALPNLESQPKAITNPENIGIEYYCIEGSPFSIHSG